MLQAVISLTFFLVFSAYLFIGIYSLTINTKAASNRMFLLICIALSIWTISFAIENSARTCEEALLWRRVSIMGKGIVYGMILHFILILTEKHSLLKKKWVYLILYFPSVVNIFVLNIFKKIVNDEYDLAKTTAGWAFIPKMGIFDLFFNCYCILFSVIAIGLVLYWNKNTEDLAKKKYSHHLIGAFGFTIAAGNFTDTIFNRLLDYKMPSLEPLIIMFPMVAIFLSIKKHDLMHLEKKVVDLDEGIILADQNRVVFFKYVAALFYAGSMLNLLHYFLYPAQLVSVILFSTILTIIGAAIFLLPYCSWQRDIQDDMLAVIIAFSIPLILFRFLDQYASNIVWPIPLIFMIAMAVFNKKRMLMTIAVSGIITGVYSWVRVPKLVVHVTSIDYASRIVLYGMGILFTIYVNKIYTKRLAENGEQVRFQKMLSAISNDFITITESNYNDKINDMLEKSGQYFHADSSHLYLFSKDLNAVKKHNEWFKEDSKPTASVSEEISVLPYGWWMKQMMDSRAVFVLDANMLPAEAQAEKEFLLDKHIQAVLTVPIYDQEQITGCIAYNNIKEKKTLSEMDRDQLKVLVNTLSHAVSKVEAEKEINYLAYNDLLTGLPNRGYFNNRLEQDIHLARKNEKLVGVMLIDLDGFKEVNDSMGHEWGDYVLIQVADRLSEVAGKHEVVARFGGDEFLIMISDVEDIETIQNAAEKIMEIFKELIFIKEQEFFITASGGIAIFPIDGETVDTLIKHADLAMYASKNKGKNQYTFCTLEMKEDVINKMKLTNSLYKAMDNDELELYYQPQVSIETQEIVGLEALIRWNHPTLGRIPPSVFIPLAEQTGLITPIGTWVLRTACLQNKKWQLLGYRPIRIAVNLSLDQFRSNLRQVVHYMLQETDLDPSCLELEITEGVAMKEGDLIINTLRELREMGVEISIDDFGMAYSSLSRLKELPADRLKIDMAFVQGIAPGSKDNSIIEIIIHLAKSLGLKITAEGVETEEQLDFLAEGGCDDIQGYYYYKPMPAQEIEALLKREAGMPLRLAAQNN